jgi:hypothetical protein
MVSFASKRSHWLMLKRPPSAGCVEVDKSYFGPRRVRGIRGRGAARKIPVLGLLERGDRVICSPKANCSKIELLHMMTGASQSGFRENDLHRWMAWIRWIGS